MLKLVYGHVHSHAAIHIVEVFYLKGLEYDLRMAQRGRDSNHILVSKPQPLASYRRQSMVIDGR